MEIDGEESSNIEDRRDGGGSFGGGGGFGVGGMGGGGGGFGIPMGGGLFKGGFGLIAVVVVALVLGVDPMAILGGLAGGGGGTTQQVAPQPRQAARPAADDPERHFVALVLKSTELVWADRFKELGRQYATPTLVLFRNQTPTACGTGQTAMGPFYCPGDSKAYIDLAFFDELATRFNAPGRFPQAYVLAHEIGHHVQNLLGTSDKGERAEQRAGSAAAANKYSVALELQADCFAGVWAAHASEASGGKVTLEAGDLEEGLRAAASVGDDTLQKQTQGRVVPDSFTHGSAAERQRWLKQGYDSGDLKSCDTFAGLR